MSIKKNFEAAFDRIRTLEDELKQAKADRDVLGDVVHKGKALIQDLLSDDGIPEVALSYKKAIAAAETSGALSRAGGKR